MEPKFVTLQSVVDDLLKGPAGRPMDASEIISMFDQTGYLYGNFNGTHIDARNNSKDPIITEDIDCEIVEPKRLPSPPQSL